MQLVAALLAGDASVLLVTQELRAMRVCDALIEQQWEQAPRVNWDGYVQADRLGVYVTEEYSALSDAWLGVNATQSYTPRVFDLSDPNDGCTELFRAQVLRDMGAVS